MRYVISDIHGCYEEYMQLLKEINFSDNDELYVLGDVVDRGPEPVKVLQDMMKRSNVTFILGNHDLIMYMMMKKLLVVAEEDNYATHLTVEDYMDYMSWLQDGGAITVEKFRQLSDIERMDIIDYLSEASVYEVLENNEKKYILVHAGLGNFESDKGLDEYELYELMEERMNYSKRYYSDINTFIITGHTPTVCIKDWEKAEVYIKNGHIAIDCGCISGGRLAAYCIETEAVKYINKL